MKKMKKISAVMVALIIALCLMVFSAAAGSDDFEYESYGEGTIEIISYYLDGGDIEIPSEIDGNKVVSIAEGAFVYNDMTSITIPVTVKNIGTGAFDGCTNLVDVYYGGTLVGWEENLFASYSDYEQNENEELFDATLHFEENDNVISQRETGIWSGEDDIDFTRYVFEWDFKWYLDLNDAKLTFNGETDMGATGEGMFDPCYPDALESTPWLVSAGGKIGRQTPNIKEVVIGDGMKNIQTYAFVSCGYLESIVIPKTVTTVGYCAFEECNNLNDIYYSGTAEEWSRIKVMYGNDSLKNATVHYNYVYNEHKHSFEALVRNLPTCIVKGDIIYKCDCGYIQKLVRTEKLVHNHEIIIGKEATCTENGYTEGIYCNDCGKWIKVQEVVLSGHIDADCNGICDNCEINLNDIKVGETKAVEIESGSVTYLKFIPVVTGLYTFEGYSDEDNYGYLFDKEKNMIASNDDSYGLNFSLTCELQKGEVYYWGVKLWYNYSGIVNVTLSCDEIYCVHNNKSYAEESPATCTQDGYTEGVFCNDCETWIEGHEIVRKHHTDSNGDGVCDICEEDAVNILEEGNCGIDGDNVRWILYDNGELIISGTGEMGDYYDFEFESSSPFYKNSAIEKVVIGEGVTCIGSASFDHCSNLNSVIIPDSVTKIGDAAFSHCTSLDDINLPDSITNIGSYAFSNCSSLTEMVIPDAVTNIYGNTFYYCENLSDIIIPDSVTNIYESAFYNCKSLVSIDLPENLELIESRAFSDCTGLTSISIPSGVKIIGAWAFADCSSLDDIELPANSLSILSRAFEGTAYYNDSSNWNNGVLYIDKHLIKASNPSDVYEIKNGTLSVAEEAFQYCDSLQEIVIPMGVTAIEEDTFYNCSSLTKVVIPNSVTSIGRWAFEGCESLTNISVPGSVTEIQDSAFEGCSALTNIFLPDSITSIKYEAFYDTAYYDDESNWIDGVLYIGNHLIEAEKYLSGNYIIKEGTVTIAEYAFSGCYDLNEITIPYGVVSLGKAAFSGCSGLTHISLPNSVKTLGSYVFSECDNLESITIPVSVTDIGYASFNWSSMLQDVYYCGTKTQWDEISIDDMNSNLIEANIHFLNDTKTQIDTNSDVQVFYDSSTFQEHVALKVEQIATDDGTLFVGNYTKYIPYDISFLLDGDEVQPIGYVTVKIPVPDSFDAESTVVYYMTSNGISTKLESYYEDGYIIFETDHFSKYVIVDESSLHTHIYEPVTSKKATTSVDGVIVYSCSCGKVKSTQTIAKISSVTLSATKYIHDGKNKTPTVTVKDANGKTLVKNTDYKLSVASSRKGIGKYTVKVTFIGKYSGTKNVYFTILPGKPASVKSAAQTTSSVKLAWSKVSGAAGYTVYRYSPSKKAYVKAGTTEGASLTVKGLNSATNYTFKIVSYGKTSGGKVYNSEGYTLLKTATKTKTPAISKITTTKGKAVLTHTNVSGETGYTVYYSTKKDSGFKKYNNFKADTTRCDITKLTSGKTYYFKVRTYIKTDSGYVYSPWSVVKGIKVK